MVATRSFKLVILLLLCTSLTVLLAESAPNQQKDTYNYDEYFVEKTILKNAVSKGAVCLDGSPPAYYMDRGFGEGAQSWMIHLSALLIGSSAGAYPAMLYCYRFSKLLPNTPRLKCLTDSGYFIDVNKNLQKGKGFETIYKALVTLHGSAKALPKSCTSRMKPELCFFPQNMQQYIKTPLYTIMSPFDIVQVGSSLGDYYNAIKQNN